MDQLEIEVKFHAPDIQAVRDRILSLGAQPAGRFFEANSLWDTLDGALKKNGRLLRIRQDENIRLTFKAPVETPEPGFKVRRELEVHVDDRILMEGILSGLGYTRWHCYEKWRETFVLYDLHIVIDEMPYGAFLELEGTKEDIERAAGDLGLTWEKRILANYFKIFSLVKTRENLTFQDAVFDNFSEVRLSIAPYIHELEAGPA